jgi:Transposase DDE domain group 1
LTEHATTECLLFPDIFDRPVIAKFDQRQGSSDGGAILLKAADRRLGLTAALTACLEDERQPGKVRHELSELLTQRILAIACGYEDANDAARLANTPLSSNVHFRMSRPRSSARWKRCSRDSEDAPKNWANKTATVRIASLTVLSAARRS